MPTQEDDGRHSDLDRLLQQVIDHVSPSDAASQDNEPEHIPSEFEATLAESYVAIGFICAMTASIAEKERPEINFDLIQVKELTFLPETGKIEVLLDRDKVKEMPAEHLDWVIGLMITSALQELEIILERTEDSPPRLFLLEKQVNL